MDSNDKPGSLAGMTVAAIPVVTTVLAVLYVALYRLYASPLAAFPGPKLAAVTKAYQFHFDVIKAGRFPWELMRLHAKYGPIVRIGPDEIHVADPDFFDVLYVGSNQRRDKDLFCINGFGMKHAAIATEKHDHHRMRRAAMNPFFSTQAVARLRPVIQSKIDYLCDALSKMRGTGEPVVMDDALMALTTDIITEYSFAKSHDFLKKPAFAPEWGQGLIGAAQSSNLFRYIPGLVDVLLAAPPWLVNILDPKLMQLINLKIDQRAQITSIMSDYQSGNRLSDDHRTIFEELLSSDLPESEKGLSRLSDEAQNTLAAGSTTTVHHLKSTIYFILADEQIRRRVQTELEKAIPDASSIPPLHVLEQLPFLNAVVKEGYRMCDGASTRLARVAPDTDLKCRDTVIPKGTIISMSTYIQHRHPTIFPDPETFDPERWLGQDASKRERYLVNFSKGTRGCVGINLAKAEIYFTLAALFRRFDLKLFDTDRSRDVDTARDFFVPYASKDSKGVRVTVEACN